MRSEGDQLLEAADEAIRIGAGRRGAGGDLSPQGRRQAQLGQDPPVIAKIDSARRAGVDVQADMYAYTAGGTGLAACTPPWASENGKLIENLQTPATRARIRAEMLSEAAAWENLCLLATPDGVLVLGLRQPQHASYVGKRLAEVARAMGKPWPDAVMDLLVAERQRIGTVYFLMSEENVALGLRQPWMKFGTDAGGANPDSAKGTLTHPRAYGNFPKIMGAVRARRARHPAGGRRPQGDVGRGDASLARAAGHHAPGLLRRCRRLRPGDHRRPRHLREPAPALDRGPVGAGERRARSGRRPPTGATPGRVLRGPGWRRSATSGR
jgi:dihydroorotase/N-acyl-D-amino-acid deacylase